VLDTVGPGPIVLIGTSLGAAVALQGSGDDPRVTAVVAAETFSDSCAPSRPSARRSSSPAASSRWRSEWPSRRGISRSDAVSPIEAAPSIRIPVLLVHGAADIDTPPAHSERVFRKLAGSKRLMVDAGRAAHESLNGLAWKEIQAMD